MANLSPEARKKIAILLKMKQQQGLGQPTSPAGPKVPALPKPQPVAPNLAPAPMQNGMSMPKPVAPAPTGPFSGIKKKFKF